MDSMKRCRVEEEEDDDGDVKRRKINGEDDLRRVAEIVLVLSAMGRMRGGNDPTVAEKSMMAEAREKVVDLCQELAPKDILPTHAFGLVIEDLGLNRFKEHQELGFRPPRLSISDQLAHAKRRMEESKAFSAQPTSYPSHNLQKTGAAGENHGTPTNVRVFSSDKAGHLHVSGGSIQPSTPVVHASSPTSMPSQFQPSGTALRQPMVSGSVAYSTGKDSPAVAPRVDRAHIRPDGRPNGPFVSHIPVNSSTDKHMVRSTPSLQPQPSLLGNSGTKNNTSLSASQKTAPAVGQTFKPVGQTAPALPPTAHHPVQGVQYVINSPFVNHLEISKLIQKLLEQKIYDRPAWTTPSRDYMNRALTCQFCKLIINEIENVLVCDACEKGYHVGCLQSYNAKGIPRGEWHCPRCLSMNRGKPFPPKYGRVTRNVNGPKTAVNTAGIQMSSEKKAETADQKVKQPSSMTNGNPGSAGKTAEPSSESNRQSENQIDENGKPIPKHGKHNLGKPIINASGIAEETTSSRTSETSIDKPCQQELKSELPPSPHNLVTETEPRTPDAPLVISKSDPIPTPSNQNDLHERVTEDVDVPVPQHLNCNGVLECNKHDNDERDDKAVKTENLFVGRKGDGQDRDAESLEKSHNVDWIGDPDRVSDEKKFFRSCCINRVVYAVQDYALFCSGNGKLIPVKLQDMWEDSKTSSKWLLVHKCYFPDDLPKEVGRPGAPQSNEVYESTHDTNVMAAFIQGQCEVLPFRKFGEDMETSNKGFQANDSSRPVFIRNWFYDESRQAFCPSAS